MEKLKPRRNDRLHYWKSKGGYITNVEGLSRFMPSSQIDVRPLKKIDHLMNTLSNCYKN